MAKTTGNVYVDASYSEDVNGTPHPITGELLIFGVNAFATLTGGTVSAVPEDGSA